MSECHEVRPPGELQPGGGDGQRGPQLHSCPGDAESSTDSNNDNNDQFSVKII